MPWILSVFEIRTRAPADSIESWWLRHIPSTSHFALYLLLPLVPPLRTTRVYTSSTSNQAFFSVLCSFSHSLSLSRWPSLTDHFPFSFSHRNFPAMYLSSVLSDPDISISFTFLAKAIRRQRARISKANVKRTFRSSEWEVTPLVLFYSFGAAWNSSRIVHLFYVFVQTLCIVLGHFNRN